MSEALHGTVTLVIGARTYTLQPTLEAALKIESRLAACARRWSPCAC